MKLIDMSVKDFINTLASDAVAPGGGSVSALAGANGSGLIEMAGALTVNKKKFKELDEDTQNNFITLIKFFKDSKDRFLTYIDEDTDAFNQLMDAFRMPKMSDVEKEERSLAIQLATIGTIIVPLEVCRLAVESLRKVETVMNYANKNTISDQGVGVMMLANAAEGSAMNVLINLSGLNDQDEADNYRLIVQQILEEVRTIKTTLLDKIKL